MHRAKGTVHGIDNGTKFAAQNHELLNGTNGVREILTNRAVNNALYIPSVQSRKPVTINVIRL